MGCRLLFPTSTGEVLHLPKTLLTRGPVNWCETATILNDLIYHKPVAS